ncbi:hypothetical protein [Nocardia sienata]|uniref:hypothetical protein n=1 Tax=Nocardia sienata TaxID=248552 RepID=UPI0012EE4AE6|nr:hypothetical protein [Nocardia sienata]
MSTADDEGVSSPGNRGQQIYEVFNSDYSVGVACNTAGVIIGLHLGESIMDNTDAWLAAELVRVARLARMKSEVGRRTILLERGVLPHVADTLGLPNEVAYQHAEKAEFGDGF